MSKTMRVSGAEALSNSAQHFRRSDRSAARRSASYIDRMTRSELMAIMVGGFAQHCGWRARRLQFMMLSGYFPNIASHLISASLLSAPAAFIFAKVLVPEREEPMTRGDVKFDVPIEDANLVDAAANGTSIGWQLALQRRRDVDLLRRPDRSRHVGRGLDRSLFHQQYRSSALRPHGRGRALRSVRDPPARAPSQNEAWLALLGVFALFGWRRLALPGYAGTVVSPLSPLGCRIFFYSGGEKRPSRAI